MATIEAKTTESVDPTENLSLWLDKKDAGPDPAEPEGQAAEPAVAPPDWREVTLPEDVDHGFFRGKKVGVLYESYKHAESAKQQAERERNEARAELDRVRREREADEAARRVQYASEPRKPEPDPDEEIEKILLNNPKEGIRAIREQTLRDAQRQTEELWQRSEAQREQQQYMQRIYTDGGKAYDDAYETLARTDPNLTRDLWNLRAPALMHHFTNTQSPLYGDGNNLLRADAYIDTYKQLYGGPAQTVVVKPAAEPPMPPGAKRPGSGATAETRALLDKDDRAARQVIFESAKDYVPGLTVEGLIKRGERRG